MGQLNSTLRTITDWTLHQNEGEVGGHQKQKTNDGASVVGTDITYSEGDLLKHTNREVVYESNPPPIVREDLPVPGAFLLHGLLTKDECDQYISISEEMGYAVAPLRNLDTVNSTSFTLTEETLTIRNSQRVLFDAPQQMAEVLNQRLLPHLPAEVECKKDKWKVCTEECINKRWRFNKYNKGNYFKPHFDAGFVYSKNKETLFTFILYLSEGCVGGETIFYPGNKKFSWEKAAEENIEVKVIPKAGTALIFYQCGDLNPRHEGAELLGDFPKKYILRSDLAYERITPIV